MKKFRLICFQVMFVLLLCIPVTVAFSTALSVKSTPATSSAINGPSSLVLNKDRYLFVVEEEVDRVRRIDLRAHTIITVAGNGKDCCYKEGTLASQVGFRYISSIAMDSHGNLLIGDGEQVRRVEARSGLIFTVAGNGRAGDTTEGSSALSASFRSIEGLAVDRDGNLFISDGSQGKVFRIDSAIGTVSRVAGNGKAGFSGDGGPAVNASFLGSRSISLDSTGNIFVADVENCRIRRIDHSTGLIETIAKTGGFEQNCPPRPGVIPWQPSPEDPAVDTRGNVYFVQPSVDLVARAGSTVDAQVVVAGTGRRGFSGDGGPATSAELANPSGLTVDSEGTLFISEFVNNRIRRVDAKTKLITTVAGNGLPHRIDPEM